MINLRAALAELEFQITSDKGAVKVISPIDDTPAYRAGIKAGDYITHIDGQQVFDLSLNQAVKKMKGHPGNQGKADHCARRTRRATEQSL